VARVLGDEGARNAPRRYKRQSTARTEWDGTGTEGELGNLLAFFCPEIKLMQVRQEAP